MMQARSRVIRSKIALVFLLWLMHAAVVVDSSHFRGAIIMVRPQPGGAENEMEIAYHISWRRSRRGHACDSNAIEQETLRSGEGNMVCQTGCSGTITPMSYICTDFSATEDWSFGENRITYTFSSSSSSTIRIGFSGNAWIAPFNSNWNVPTTFSLMRRNDTGRINSTPRAITAPVIRLQEGCNHTLPIAVSDPDGDIVRCRWADGNDECGGICNRFPGAILDSLTCTFRYEANRGTGLNAAAIMIEDFTQGSEEPLSSVGLQFLVSVFSSTEACSSQPQFVPPTIPGGSCVAIPSGATFFSQIIASSGGSDASITEFQTTSPIGLRRGEIQRIGESENYFLNVTWTPETEQENQTHLFCYTAVNSRGLTNEQNCLQFLVGYLPPQPLQNTLTPNQARVHPFLSTWTINFDQRIQRALLTAFIMFFDNISKQMVYQIDASQSLEVVVSNNSISFSPAYRFSEQLHFYIIFDRGIVQGLEGCGPGNEPVTDPTFWTFETMDITPPIITFTSSPLRSNENITTIWTSNEPVSWTCSLHFETENSPVNCSEAFWDGKSLRQGMYQLVVRGTDLQHNFATALHSFVVDLTPPVAFINQRPNFVSYQHTARLGFSCNEICTFDCLFYDSNSTQGDIISCNQHSFLTPELEHDRKYVFAVIPTDDVGNQGEKVMYTWQTDFENPQISSISDFTTLCSEISPDVTGHPTATDNRPEPVTISYQDSKEGCTINRTWTATDIAGNVATSVQSIYLEYPVSISYVPVLAFPCDSTVGTFDLPSTTASAPNPCSLPLDMTHTDSVSSFSCPGEFIRNWTVQACGSTATAIQTIRFFDTCPPNACGRNESPPQGICSFGECSCNRPWFGTNCDELVFKPEIAAINNTILQETESYSLTIPLIQGTPPLSWTLLSSPVGLQLFPNIQQIMWQRAQAGNHTVSVQVENEVGVYIAAWTLIVVPGYTVSLNPIPTTSYPRAQPVTLSGDIEYIDGNQVHDSLAGIVPVLIDVTRGDTTQTIASFSQRDGSFATVFYPTSSEYGSYTAQVRHPQSVATSDSINWLFLGFRMTPSSISMSGEALTNFQQTFYNVTMICNDGPRNLTGLEVTTNIPSTEDIQVDLFLKQVPLTRHIATDECIFIDIAIFSNRPLNRYFYIQVNTNQGASTTASVNVRIQQILPSLQASPVSVSSRIVRGTSTVFQFNITNVGRATANNIQPVLPDSPIFSFVGLGSTNGRFGNRQFDLHVKESATLSIQAMVSEEMPLGMISTSFSIVSDEVSLRIPISLIVSSDTLMNLTVTVEDEYTYFADGQPLVSDASVTLINHQRNIRTTVTTEERNGQALFLDLNEDRYELVIEAPGHSSLHQVVVISIDNPVLTFFLERQAVTYTWSVTPVAFEDTYTITLEADFETNVPIPVVTVSPNEINLEELELGIVDSIQLNITNHGLIRADDVNINLPTDHPFLEFTTDNEILGNLEALSSITAVIHVSRKTIQKRTLLSTLTWTIYVVNVAYSYICGDLQLRGIPIILRKSERVIGGNGGRVVVWGRGGFSFNGFTSNTQAFCNDCLQSIIGCIPTPNFPLAGCIPMIAGGSGVTGPVDIISWINCAIPGNWVRTGRPKQAKQATEDGLCIYNVYNACLTPEGSSRKKRQSSPNILRNHLESMYPIDLSLDLAVEVLGDNLWLSVGDSNWVSETLMPVFDDTSEDGVLVSSSEMAAILSVPPPGATTHEDVETLVNRLSNTLSGWNSGRLEPVNGSNIASYSFIESLTAEINRYNEIAVDKGFSSYLDAYTFSANELNQLDRWEEEEGVCAVVRIRVEQELAVTREAFLARLEIDNKENLNLEHMTLEIIITNTSDRSYATHLFFISNETLGGSLVRSGESWTLSSGQSGSVEWLIVPLSEAAPQSDQVYGVGGTLRYSLENNNVTIPLLPTLITVTPDPSLLVHYFWERTVIADDPFTDEIEPSIPFTLGVIVKNAGYGVASSLTLSSGQPEIIENEKGLLINFMIIGSNIGNDSITPSLSLTLGDLAPQSTVVVRWLMISSLQGEFRNFSATFQNTNPLGDPRLSILDELEIHELVRNVRINVENDDGILDFLVNEQPDIGAYPDALYDSKTLARYNVSRGEVISVQPLSGSAAPTLVVSTVANETGWNYYRYTDTDGLLTQTAFTLNTTKQTTSGNFFIPPENTWITLTDEQLTLHIVDYKQSNSELNYVLTLCSSNCTPIAIPFIRPSRSPPTIATAAMATTGEGSVSEYQETTTAAGSPTTIAWSLPMLICLAKLIVYWCLY